MSSRPLFVLMALTSILVVPGSAAQVTTEGSISELLIQDEIDRAEALLKDAPRSAENIAFQGEIEFRRGHFDAADVLYRSALELDDQTARAHFGLGKLAMAKVKIKEAVQLFSKAIELAPNEPLYRLFASEASGMDKNTLQRRKHLEEYVRLNPIDEDRVAETKAALEILSAFDGVEIAAIETPDQLTPIRFRKFLNLIFADVMVNGQGPFNFAIDSGATQVVLSEQLAIQLGLKPITTTMMHGVGGSGKVESRIFRTDQIQIGDVKIKNVPVGTFNDPLLTQVADGIISTAMLSDFIVTINYPESRMELTRNGAPASDSLPVWYFSNLLLVPLEVNGQPGNFIVDTGAVVTVLSHGLAAALGINENTPGAKVEMGLTGVGGMQGAVLRVPGVTLNTARHSERFDQVVAIDLKQISKMVGTEISGVVGSDFFQQYRLTLDYYAAEVRLNK